MRRSIEFSGIDGRCVALHCEWSCSWYAPVLADTGYIGNTQDSLKYQQLRNAFLQKSFFCFYGAIGAFVTALGLITAGIE
jgi:hypothetical protein